MSDHVDVLQVLTAANPDRQASGIPALHAAHIHCPSIYNTTSLSCLQHRHNLDSIQKLLSIRCCRFGDAVRVDVREVENSRVDDVYGVT
jgi:hypothetical protein